MRSQVTLRHDLERESPFLTSDAYPHLSGGRRVLENVERGEVDGADDLRRAGRDHIDVDVDPHPHACAVRCRAELHDQSTRIEQRREDAVGKLLHLRQRPPRFTLHLVEERLRRRGIGVHPSRGDLEVFREPHQILLHSPVQRSLDAATVGIGDQRESLPRSSELLDLAAQPIEGRLLVGLFDLQRMPSRAWVPGILSLIARAASSGQHGIETEGSIPASAREPL